MREGVLVTGFVPYYELNVGPEERARAAAGSLRIKKIEGTLKQHIVLDSDVTLKGEFDLQQLYLDIEAVRFPERLIPVFDLPEDLEEARIPGMILQPLVENSVKYAVSAETRPVTITIAAREEFDRLVVTVSDDGPGVPEGTPHGFGIGLANVQERLEARFGADIGFTSTPIPGGYKTEIRIPLSRPAKARKNTS